MNKSPDSRRHRRLEAEPTARELTFEARIRSDDCLTGDSELAADQEFRRELAAIGTPSLPPALRQQIVSHVANWHAPMGWMALAAAVVMSLLVVLALDSGEKTTSPVAHQLTASDWAELRLALDTLDASGRRVAQVTEREVRPHMKRPDIKITSFPEADAVWNRFRTSLQSTR